MKSSMYSFEQNIKKNVVDPVRRQEMQPGHGIVLNYDQKTNTATVLASAPGSTATGEIYRKVPCPVVLGQQSVAPEVGRPCWITFKDGGQANPAISHFFNFDYQKFDYVKHNRAINNTPSYIFTM